MPFELTSLGSAGFQLAEIGGPYWPLVDAGADVGSHPNNTQVSRTATEDDRGSAITSREWRIIAGPTGVGTVLSTAALLQWTPTVSGGYVLRYSATNAVGTGTDTMQVVVAGATNDIDLFLAAGQSNMVYIQGDPAIAPDPADGTAYDYAAGTLGTLNDKGGPVPPFAVEYYNQTGRIAAYINRAEGGSSQTAAAKPTKNWTTSDNLYSGAVDAVNDAIAELTALGYTVTFRGILWDQGGADGIAIDDGVSGVDKATYKSEFLAMIARFRTEFGASLPFYIFRLGRPNTGDTAGWIDIRTAQDEVVAADALTHFIYEDQVDFPTLGLHRDKYHYTQEGYNLEAEAGAIYVANDLFGGGGATTVSIDQSDPQSVQEDATLQLSATVTNAVGSTSWSSDTPAVATVNSSTGLVTGVAEGSAIITATNNGVSDTITVNVTPVSSTTTVDIDQPSPQSVEEDDTLQLTVTVTNGSGGTTWGTSNASVATVSSSGLVTGVAPGSATITATNNGVDDAIVVNVTAIPSALPPFLEAYDGNGWVTIPVAFADGVDAAPIDVGDLGIAFDGSLLDSRRAVKNRWTITTRPITGAEKTSIMAALRNGPLVQFNGGMLDEVLTLCAVRERGIVPAATSPSARRWVLRFEMLED